MTTSLKVEHVVSTPTTRREAIRIGVIKYRTGKPCCRGHISDRYAASGACVDCAAGDSVEQKHRERECRAGLDGRHFALRRASLLARTLPVESEVKILLAVLASGPSRPIDLIGKDGFTKNNAYWIFKTLALRGELMILKYVDHELNGRRVPVYDLTPAGRRIAELCNDIRMMHRGG